MNHSTIYLFFQSFFRRYVYNSLLCRILHLLCLYISISTISFDFEVYIFYSSGFHLWLVLGIRSSISLLHHYITNIKSKKCVATWGCIFLKGRIKWKQYLWWQQFWFQLSSIISTLTAVKDSDQMPRKHSKDRKLFEILCLHETH